MRIPATEYATELLAINTFGEHSQIDIAIEECSELINALCKFRRERNSAEDVQTEIADVLIVAEQMAIIFGEEAVREEKRRKLERLNKRIEEYKRKSNERV